MKQTGLLILLGSAAWASPLAARNEATPAKPSYITSCEAAHNCEIYTDAKGKLKPRFKQGMEPGTAAYDDHQKAAAHTKRGGSNTEITVSDSTIWWGCGVDPVQTLNNVSSVCQTSGACLSGSPYTLPVGYITPDSGDAQPNPETLSISATGNYPSWLHNGIVEALQAVMSAKGVVNTQSAHWGSGPASGREGALTAGTCQVSQAPSEIVLTYFSAPNTLEATVDVTVTLGSDSGGFCGGALGDSAALVGAISGAFGAAGAGIAAIFGAISATCTISGGT